MKIALTLEYDGAPYQGWQRQPHGPSVQAEVERVLAQVHGSPVTLYGAGRTDAGVHARGQVAHFRTDREFAPERWVWILNHHLPESVRIVDARRVDDSFHAQRSATAKLYEYRVLNRHYGSALDRRVYFFPQKVNWASVRACFPHLIGKRDFRAFQGAGASVKSTERELFSITLVQRGESEWALRFHGSGFLKQMVRSLTGTLLDVGTGKIGLEQLPLILDSGDRRRAGHTAPPEGLVLIRVEYPPELFC